MAHRISHLHGDHCDPVVLAQLDKRVPVFILDRSPNFLERYLRERGFHDIRKVPEGKFVAHGPWQLTILGPFSGHGYFETRIGNLIDSSILLRAGGTSFLNFTDNFPTVEAAARLREEYGPLTLAAVPYNLDTLAAVVKVLRPDALFPCSSEYALAGSRAAKNRYLIQANGVDAARHLVASGYDGRLVRLGEGAEIELETRQIRETLPPWEGLGREAYGETLRGRRFDHEDDPPLGERELRERLLPALREARAHLWARQRQLGFFDETAPISRSARRTSRFAGASPTRRSSPHAPSRRPTCASPSTCDSSIA